MSESEFAVKRKLSPSETYYWILGQRQPLNNASRVTVSYSGPREELIQHLMKTLELFPLFLCRLTGEGTQKSFELAKSDIPHQIKKVFYEAPAQASSAELIEAELAKSFSVDTGPLGRITVLQEGVDPSHYVVILCFSHITCDGKSVVKFIEQFGRSFLPAGFSIDKESVNLSSLEELLPGGFFTKVQMFCLFLAIQLFALIRAKIRNPVKLESSSSIPRRSKFILRTVSINHRKENRLSHNDVHRLFVSALKNAFLEKAKYRWIRVVHPVDLRHELKEKLESKKITHGCYVSSVNVYTRFTNDTENVMAQIEKSFRFKIPTATIVGLPIILPRGLKDIPKFIDLIRAAGPAQFMLSNVGRLTVKSQYENLKVLNIEPFASLSDAGDLLLIALQVFDHFNICVQYIEGSLTRQQAEQIANQVENSIIMLNAKNES